MSGLKWLLDQYFQLPRWERIGNIILVMAILACFVVMKNWPQSKLSAPEIKKADMVAANLEQNAAKERDASQYTHGAHEIMESDSSTAHFFIEDLTKATENDLEKCGLSRKVAIGMMHYMQKGGKIRTMDDARKIYGMTPSMLANLAAHTHLDSLPQREEGWKKGTGMKSPAVVDINMADSSQLVKVRGIGAKTVARILQYRDKLGGFYSVEQLKEVYGIKPENFEKMKEQLSTASFVPFIHINKVSPMELAAFVYFKKDNLAEILVQYRRMHGDFKKPEDLRKCKVVTDEVFSKIVPYLVFD